MSGLNALPRVAKLAVVGALLIALALVAKGFGPANGQPIGVSSTPIAPRAGVLLTPRGTTTTTTPGPLNPTGRNPFAPAK
ncbi:MAG: hypothetical protein JWO37_2050 [Acidimicrobiales bacterium]|jgi:hypothetical protein|nr:hypothetical protein [Acidimicrobiales bacterium]